MLATIAAVLWIVFDVGATLVTASPLSLWYWRAVIYGGSAVALFTLVVGVLDWMRQRRERTEDQEERANLLRENREQIQQHFNEQVERLRADFAIISQKLEPPDKKVEEMNQRVNTFAPTVAAPLLGLGAAASVSMNRRRRRIFATAGAGVDAQKRSAKDDPKNGNSN